MGVIHLETPISRSIINKIKDNGGGIYLVGGAVRNYLMDEPIKDYDFCVTNISKNKFAELFPRAKLVGKHFGVFLLDGYEFAMARTEQIKDNPDNRRDYDVNLGVSIEEDLKRRDFTVNAIAYDLINNKIVDPYNGQKDIQDKVLRAFNNAFEDDPLRVFRAARFSAEYDFRIDANTTLKMLKMCDKVKTLPAERVFEEMKKALKGKYACNFFLKGSLSYWFKELSNLIMVPQPIKYHPEKCVFIHSLQSLHYVDSFDPAVKFAALVHDLGKGLTPEEEYPHHYGHCKNGIKALDILAERLKIPNKWYDYAKLVIEEHMRVWKWKEMGPGKVVRLFKKIQRSPMSIEDFIKVLIADKRARVGGLRWAYQNPANIEHDLDKFVKLYYRMFEETGGEDIDEEPGPKLGRKLFQYRCHWIKRERKNILKRGTKNE
ncbi:MAG: HD domain-containing protein [archaeon]